MHFGTTGPTFTHDCPGLSWTFKIRLCLELKPGCGEALYNLAEMHEAEGSTALLKQATELADLSFEPACLEFYRNDRPVLTASREQVRQPAYTSSIDHWRNYFEWLGPVAELPPH